MRNNSPQARNAKLKYEYVKTYLIEEKLLPLYNGEPDAFSTHPEMHSDDNLFYHTTVRDDLEITRLCFFVSGCFDTKNTLFKKDTPVLITAEIISVLKSEDDYSFTEKLAQKCGLDHPELLDIQTYKYPNHPFLPRNVIAVVNVDDVFTEDYVSLVDMREKFSQVCNPEKMWAGEEMEGKFVENLEEEEFKRQMDKILEKAQSR